MSMLDRVRLMYWRYMYGMEVQRKIELENIYLYERMVIAEAMREANHRIIELEGRVE